MNDRNKPEPVALAQLPRDVLEEVIRQFRSARNDILRYAIWNLRNVSDEEFNHIDDQKLVAYLRQDLLETRFVDRGRRVSIVQVWQWFDHQLTGVEPLLIGKREVILNVEDKDLEKPRKRIEELESFLPILRSGDLEGFKRVKYKLRRTVLRLTYDIHHLNKKLEKHRKNVGLSSPRGPAVEGIETPTEIPESQEQHV